MATERIDVDQPLENADWPKRTPDKLDALKPEQKPPPEADRSDT